MLLQLIVRSKNFKNVTAYTEGFDSEKIQSLRDNQNTLSAPILDGTAEFVYVKDGRDDFYTVTESVSTIITAAGGFGLRGLKVTVGYPGASGCDYLFTSAANTTEQSIELMSLLPAWARMDSLILVCTENCNLTVTWDYGTVAGGAQFAAGGLNDDLGNIYNSSSAVAAFAVARSIFLNATPGANWDTMTTGKWEFSFVYMDYSLIE